jgi:hypothetical protein
VYPDGVIAIGMEKISVSIRGILTCQQMGVAKPSRVLKHSQEFHMLRLNSGSSVQIQFKKAIIIDRQVRMNWAN